MSGARLFHSDALVGGKNPGELGLEFTSVRRVELAAGSRADFETAETEMCVVVIQGAADFRSVLRVGRTETGRAELKDMVFLPPGSKAEFFGGGAVLMAYEAPSELGADFGHIRFAAVDGDPKTHKIYGKAETGCVRDVWNYVDSGYPCSRLMMGLCAGRDGGWTAWPPHEHAAEREEVYVYFDMEKSFGVQLVYEAISEPGAAMVVREGDLVSIPRGFHPNAGSPAGRISYVYCMTARKPGERNFMDLRIQKEYGEKFE
jgi:5-deoxy-glucuronate isomerase